MAKLRINTSNLLGRYLQTIIIICHRFLAWQPHLDTRGKSIFQYVGMVRNYWTTLLSTKIGKTNFTSKNTATRWYGYPIYLVKNNLVTIAISTSYRLLTCAYRTTARRFPFRQSATKWVETLHPKGAFWHFPDFTRGKYSFSSPIPSIQCCATVWATFRKQETPQLWVEGTGEGCGFSCSLKLPYLSTMSQKFCCWL